MLKVLDKLNIELQHSLNDEDYSALTMLYYPLIQDEAYLLYQVMCAIAQGDAKIQNHLLIKNLTGYSIEIIEKNRLILEKYQLIKTLYNPTKNSYIYRLHAPLHGDVFLRHEVFGRLYYKKMGKQVFEFTKLHFAKQLNEKNGFQDISEAMDEIIREVWKDKDEEVFERLKPIKDDYHNEYLKYFNQERFLRGLSLLAFPKNLRTSQNMKEIARIGYSYGISEAKMKILVGQSVDLSNNTLSVSRLESKAMKQHSDADYQKSGNSYDVHPNEFLRQLQAGIEVSEVDKKLNAMLLDDYKLKRDVVNVLLEYVLKQLNQKLSKAYVEKVASSWVRLKIDTHEKALEHIQSEDKKINTKYQPKKAELPQWYLEQSDYKEKETEEKIDKEALKEKLRKMGG